MELLFSTRLPCILNGENRVTLSTIFNTISPPLGSMPTMAAKFQVIAFGDQAVPYQYELQGLITKENKVLKGFFSEAHHVLRTEISQLSPSERPRYPAATNLRELLDAHRSSKIQNCSLDSALVCVHQIAAFIS